MKNENNTIAIQSSFTGDSFFAYSPEYKGIVADGNSIPEAVDNLQWLIDEWFAIENQLQFARRNGSEN